MADSCLAKYHHLWEEHARNLHAPPYSEHYILQISISTSPSNPLDINNSYVLI